MKGTMRYLIALFCVFLGAVYLFAEDKTEPKGEISASADGEKKKIEEQWGIRIKSIRLTAAGHMLDFRYHVIDSDKASALLNRQQKARLIHQATNRIMQVPRTRLGPMRQTAVKPPANRDYLIFFGNKNGLVKPGDKVTVVIGDFKIENLVAEK